MQARFAIEYGYVHLMSCTKKQADRAMKDQLCLLALLTDRLEQVRRLKWVLLIDGSAERPLSAL